MARIYFKLKNGGIVDDHDIENWFYLAKNKMFDVGDRFAKARSCAKHLAAIDCEVEASDETVKLLVENNHLIPAVRMYRDMHPGMGLVEAKRVIDQIRYEMFDHTEKGD